MPLETLEVRWFGEGPLAGATWDWFAALHGLGYLRTEERSDSYVVLPGVDDLGIKWRGEVSFDLKARRREVGEIRVGGGALPIVGKVEEWIKWTYPLDGNIALAQGVGRLSMVPVGKMRALYMFDVSDDADPWAIPVPVSTSGEHPQVERALFLELAAILCAERFAWSLAIEASAELGPRFEEAVQVVSSEVSRGALGWEEAKSMSYPAWLGSLSGRPTA